MIDVCIKSDYAILQTKKYNFYYGYEFDRKECECGNTIDIWGFEVIENSKSIYRINTDEMKKRCARHFNTNDCAEMLILGIGLWLEDGGLNENN